MVSVLDKEDIRFNGSDWQALNRVVAQARFQFAQDDDYNNDDPRRCAYVAQRFEGPALDWAATMHSTKPQVFEDFNGFIEGVRQAFGIANDNITALLRKDLDRLTWRPDVPVFFAEFDRLTIALGITSDETKIALLEAKLPMKIKLLLCEQALSFANYSTFRERMNCMWALDPTRGNGPTSTTKKPRCGSCGKKGHKASECRGSKN